MASKKKPAGRPISTLDDLDAVGLGVGYRPMSFQEPAQSVEPAKAPERSRARAAGDLGLQFAGGAVSGVRMMSDLFGANNAVSGGLRGAEDALRALQSAAAKADQQRIAEIMKEAENKGFADQVMAGVKAFGQAPAAMVAQALGTSVPTMAIALIPGVGQGAMAARLAAGAGVGAAQGAGNIKGVIYEEVKNNPLPGETPEQTEFRAVRAQEYGGQNTGQIALGGALGAVAGSTGMERALSGLRNGVTQAAPGLVARVGMGAAAEALPEIPQGGQEKLASNLALRNEGFDVDPMAGVYSGATMEGLAGGVMGGATAVPRPRVIGEREPSPQPVPVPPIQPQEPPAGPMTRALNAGGIAAATSAPLQTDAPIPAMPVQSTLNTAEVFTGPQRATYGEASKDWVAAGKQGDVIRDGTGFRFAAEGSPELDAWRSMLSAKQSAPTSTATDAVLDGDMGDVVVPQSTATKSEDQKTRVIRDASGQWVPTDANGTPLPNAQPASSPADAIAKHGASRGSDLRQMAQMFRDRFGITGKETDRTFAAVLDDFAAEIESGKRDPASVDAMKRRYAEILISPAVPAGNAGNAGDEIPQPLATDILNPKGLPFKTRKTAELAAKKTPGDIVLVEGGFVVRPQESTLANTATQEVPEADAAPVQADQPAGAVSFADAADEAGGAAAPGIGEPGAVEALSNEQDAPQTANDTAAETPAIEAPAPAQGNGAAAAGVPGAGAGSGVRADGVGTYKLPDGRVSDDWDQRRASGFKATTRQQLVMDAVSKAIDAGKFYNNDVDAFVAQELGVSAEIRSQNKTNVEGGDFGYDVYHARQAVEAQRANAVRKKIADELALKPGDRIGTIIPNDSKRITGLTIDSLNDEGTTAKVTGKRGVATISGHMGVDAIKSGIERAKKNGSRKDGYDEFIAARKPAAPAATDTKADGVNTSAEPAQKAAESEQVEKPAEGAKSEPFEHAGLKVRQTRTKVGNEVVDGWLIQSPENAEREARGERQIGGDRIVETREQAIKTAEQEAKRYAKEKADRAEVDAQDKARRDADEAKKEANRGKTLLERRADAILDKPGKFPASAGLGLGTKREAMDKAIEQGRLVTEVMVDDTAAKKRDRDAVDAVRIAGYILGASNENIPVVKKGLEAQARLKEGKYQKPEYRVYSGSDRNGSFFEITKTEYDYVQKVKANQPAESKPDQETKAKTEPKAENLPEGWDTLKNGYTGLPVYRFNQGAGQPFAVVTRTEIGYEVQIRHGDKLVTSRNMPGAAKFEALDTATQMLGEASMATHKDPGEKAEPATKAVVNEAMKTAAKNKDAKPSEMRKWLLGEIDKALLQAPDRADYDEAVKRMGEKNAVSMFTGNGFLGKNAETGYVTFDVPGDGKFKVRNSTRGLLEFRKNVSASLGFKDSGQKTVKPEQNDGVQGGSGGQMAAITNMIEEGDFEAARDYAEAVGIKLEDVKVPRGDRKPQWDQFLKDGTVPPPPETRPLPPQRTPAQIAETPRLTPAEATELMEWQSLGTKDGVTKHILTFYESKARKDANLGRMTIAIITKGDRSATAWMVDGDDKTFGPLALAKKRGMEIGMAKAVADGFVDAAPAQQEPRQASDDRAATVKESLPVQEAVAQAEKPAEEAPQVLLTVENALAEVEKAKASGRDALYRELANIRGMSNSVFNGVANRLTGSMAKDGREWSQESLTDFLMSQGSPATPEKPTATKPASKTPTIDRSMSVMDAVRAGTGSLEDYKASFAALESSEESVKAELNAKTKDELLKAGGPYFYMRFKNETKPEIIRVFYKDLLNEYALGKSYGSSGFVMSSGGFAAHEKRQHEALKVLVAAQTDEDLKAFAAEVAARREEVKAKREAKKAAMEDPQTLEDFRAVMREHITDGKTRKEAFLMLTPEQRIRYDELEAETTKEARETRKRERKTEVRAADQTTGGQIIATKHTRDGYDLFVVQLADRLSREDYNTVLASAKKLGGWYSAFRVKGAVPGFQFKDKANAEAFLQLAGGDTTDAQAQAEQRRDAFEDDRSQTAVERLRTMADKLTEQAADIEGADRKTNTARRARFASRALAGAAEMKAKAKTMRNLAQAIEDDKAKFLDGIRTKSQVDMLTSIVGTAKYNELVAKHPTYAEQEKRKGEPPTVETADFAEFPAFTAYRSNLASLARQMLEVEGAKKLGQQLMKVADDVSEAYIEFAKQPGNLLKLSTFSIRRGDEVKTAIFPSKDLAERAIKRSGLTGKAIVLAEKRGVNRIIMSPSEAINAGIWTGDSDKRITLTADAGNTLVEAIGRRGNKRNGLAVPWQFQTAHDRLKALSRMGIETPAEFRSALREFIGMQERAMSNKVRELELAMAGKKNDGLDFFPTPAEVADQMVEAADLTEGMDVLEPSGGMGHIADRIRDGGVEPDVVEMATDRRELLEEKGYELVGSDFMELSGKLYDRIVMNPPFSNRRDAEHVQHAYTLLKPGGRIVAIMGEGVFFGQDKKAQDFRDWLESVGGTSEKLPPGSFMDPSLPVNTGVSARMVVIDKPSGDVKFSIDDSTGKADTADYGPATQAHRNAAARFSEAFGNRIAGSGPDENLLDAVAPREDTQRGRAAASVAAVAQHLFNREVVFVKFRGEPKFNGAVSKAAPGFIFLNIDSQKPLMAVLGHELLHEMAKSQPAMYANLSRRLDNLIKNETEYGIRLVNQYNKQGISTKGLDAREELEADIVGDNFMDAEFWRAMGENQPGLFKRIVGFITRWLDGLTQKLAGYRAFGTDEFLTDIAAARDAVAGAMREFSGAEAGAVADPVGGDVKLSAAEKQDQTQTPAFKKWFGDSVVTENGKAGGKPLVVYHGTRGDVGEFSTDKVKGRFPNSEGFYFTSRPGHASVYADSIDNAVNNFDPASPFAKPVADGANVIPAYVSIQNPKVITVSEWGTLESAVDGDGGARVREAREAGHDGVIVKRRAGDEYDGDLVIAFRPEQIKSAIGNAGTFDPDNADIRFSVAGDIKKAIPAFDVKTAPKNSWAHYRGMAMQALGRRQIVDLYAEELPQLEHYDYLVQQMDAEKNDSGAEADKLAQDWGKLKDEKQLAELMHDATLAQVDPAKPMETGVLQSQYGSLKARFDALTPEARNLYSQARDMYEGHYRKVQKAIKERIERSEMSAGQKRQIMAKMDEELFKKLKGVYFPLARFGQYVIVVKDANGEVKNVTRAETVGEAEEARKELHKAFPKHMGYSVGKVLKQAEFNAGRDAVGKGFMADLMDALDAKGIDDELRDTVAQLYLSSLPDLSWAKHGLHRKGTPGFSQDARRAFAQNMFHGARYLAKLRYADQLQDELIAMQDHVKAYEGVEEYDSIQAQQVVDEMVKRHELMMNPKASPVSTALTSLGFVFHLGLSPASAMVNLSQTALVAYPMMGAKWGWGKASAALLAASQDVVRAKNDLSTILKGAELDAYERAVKDGTIDVTLAHDLAGISQGEDQKVMWRIRPVMRAASFMFHHAERFNRQATFIAAWRMAKEASPDKTADQLYEEAKKLTYDSHFDYSSANRPRMMQGNWQRVIFLFKQYGQAMVYTLGRNAYLSMKGLTPADRALARKNLGGILAAHAAAAGVLGLPLVGPLLTAASFIGSDDDEPWDAEVAMQNVMADMVGPKAAEVMARGLSRLTPFDLSGRVALNNLILPDVQEGLEGKQWAESAMAAALGPVAGIGVNMARGAQKITEGHYMMGFEDMMPTALRGPLKAMRYAMEGAVDKTGVVITDEVGPGGIAGQALGFSPSEVRRATERKAAIMDYDRSLEDRRSSLVRQWAEARMAGDTDGVADVMSEIQAFNQKNPKRKITMPNLIQSMRARRRRIEEAEDGVYLPRNRESAREAVRF